MPKRAESAGVLLFRRVSGEIEVLVAHPGGPYWAGKDDGAWSIPKGLVQPGETPTEAAVREFGEETGGRLDPKRLRPIGTVRQAGGKVVHGFAAEGDFDPASLRSNLVEVRWPRTMVVPEIDRVAWVGLDEARRLLNPAQIAFVERLHNIVDHGE